jgi:Fur family ferric uptake transcriptional regulator
MLTAKEFKRHSKPRAVILEELQKVRSHPTASELHEIVRERLPKVSLGTVYRNLELLVQAGVVQKLGGAAEARFDGDTEPHYHIRCLQCGRVDDVQDVPGYEPDQGAEGLLGYKLLGHRLEFLGFCPACRDETEE